MQLTDKQQELVTKNHNLIYKILKDRKLNDEYYDIAAIALCEAAITYDSDIGKFSTYAYKRINNKINDELRKNNCYKRKIPTISIDDDKNDALLNIIAPNNTEDEANYGALVQIIDTYLTKRQKDIVNYLYNGDTYRNIADKLSLSQQTICLEVKKIRNIIKKHYNFEDIALEL